MNQIERTILTNLVPSNFTTRFEGGDGSCDDSGSGTGKFGAYECDTGDIFGAVFTGEA
jgi:hypothetical protein